MMRAAMAVQLRHLRYFAVVAETRNLSRAAAQLRVAQPAISRQMHDLERVLDVPLFVRHTKGVALTAAGDALADSVRQILADIAAAIERADATAAGRHGRVVLGANRAFVAAGFTTTVQEELRREHPELTLAVQDFDPPELTDRLHAGVVDLALALTDIPDAALESATLWDEIADRALVPAGHPLARRRSVTVAELGALPVVVARHGYPAALLERALATLRAHGLASPVVVVDAGLQAAHIAVATGRGWTLISRARALAPPEGTVAVPMAGFELILTGAVAWRRTEHRPVVRTVLEKVMEVARRHPNARAPTEPLRLPRPVASRAERRRVPGAVPLALELRHLRALREVAGAQTIGRAAERLGMTQPSLSRQLKELEQAVGVPLLERSARGVRVTAAGASLAGDCLALLLAVERLSHDATRVRRSMEGRCVIGAVATRVTSDLLTRTRAACTARYPDVHLLIEELPTPHQPDALRRGAIDLGLAHAYLQVGAADELVWEPLVQDRVDCALVSRTHRLAGCRRVRAADLADVAFLFVERSFYPPLHDGVMTALLALGLTPWVEATYDGLQAIWAMAAQGKGWAIGFRSQRRRPPVGTVAVPVVGLDMPWGLDMIHRRNEGSAAVLAVAGLIRSTHAGTTRPNR